MALRRITLELKDLKTESPSNYGFAPENEDNPYMMKGFVIGPNNTAYEGGIYELQIHLPRDYPFKPPNCKFITKIYHPNINTNGSMKLTILHDFWNPMHTISRMCKSIIEMLEMPSIDNCLIPSIAKEYRFQKQKFMVTATQWNCKYAGGKQMDMNDVMLLDRCTVKVLKQTYETINKSMHNLFGDIIGKIFGNIVLMYYGTIDSEIKLCSDYDPYFQFSQSKNIPNMKLFMKMLTGKTITIEINENDYVYYLKILIQNKEGIPPSQQRLVFAGRTFQDRRLLSDYHVQTENQLHLLLPLRT
eukprot:194339_1